MIIKKKSHENKHEIFFSTYVGFEGILAPTEFGGISRPRNV